MSSVVDSIVRDCSLGISVGQAGATQGTLIDHCLITRNTVNVKKYNSAGVGAPPETLKDSVVREATACNFLDFAGVCQDLAQKMTLDGVNFVDDAILH